MVTTAFNLSQGLALSPPSKLGNPVPPPTQPTFTSRRSIAQLYCLRATGYGLRLTSVRSTEDRRPKTYNGPWPLPGRQPPNRSAAIFAACSAIAFVDRKSVV